MALEISISRGGDDTPTVLRRLSPEQRFSFLCSEGSEPEVVTAICRTEEYGEVHYSTRKEIDPYLGEEAVPMPSDLFDDRIPAAVIKPEPVRSQRIVTAGGNAAYLLFRQVLPSAEGAPMPLLGTSN